jgi:hypothetical protein
MNTVKNTVGLSAGQLANGTPSDRRLILHSFFKGDKVTISPVKDINGRYLGIQENLPEIKKLEMGYVPSIESSIKLYDGIEIDLNKKEWAADWEWMQHCNEIAADFATGQSSPAAYFYIFRPGHESAKKIAETEERVSLMNYILQDSNENLYNRASILGIDMSDSVISDVKEYLLNMVNTEPAKIKQVYESKTFSLELLLLHALKKGIITKRNGVFTFGEILLGVEERAVVAYFANPSNHITTRAIESVTYSQSKPVSSKNPLEHEAVQGQDIHDDFEEGNNSLSEGVTGDQGKEVRNIKADVLTPQQKATITRKKNAANKK